MLNIFSKIRPDFSILFINPIHLVGNKYIDNLYKEIEDKKKKGIKSRNLLKYYFKYYYILESSIIHWHWFQINSFKQLIINSWVLICLFIYKISGAKIVWTIHNLYPHTNNFKNSNKILRILMAKLANFIFVHGYSDILKVIKAYGVSSEKIIVVRHPNYEVYKKSKEAAEVFFNNKFPSILISEKTRPIVLVFGQISEYKGLLEIVENCKNNNITLLIVGTTRKGEEEYLNQIGIKKNKDVIIINEFILEKDLPYFFAISDAVLFNYKEILTSGAVVLAKNYEKIVISINKGNIHEYLTGEDYLFENVRDLQNVLDDFALNF